MLDYEGHPSVEINGVKLDTSREGSLEEVTVDDDLGLPGMFSVTLRDPGGSIAASGARIGAKVEISGPSGAVRRPLITGEITTITGDYDAHGGRRIHIRGFDVSHRLHRGRQTRTFVNVTDSEICQRIAEAATIDIGTIDETDKRYEHISQANQSDWDFLKARAKAINHEVTVEDGKLNFRRLPDSSSAPGEGNLREIVWSKLVFGGELLEYRPRLTATEQVARVEVRGWDREHKREIVGRAQAGTVAARTEGASPSSLAEAFGSATFVQVNQAVTSVDEADLAARAIAEHIGSSFAEAEGTARGNGNLRAGTSVTISGVADEFGGDYVLSHTRHAWDRDGYRTHFTISGRQQRSLLALVSNGVASAAATTNNAGSNRVYGVVLAIVTANDDPKKQGRVKLKFPWLAADYESTWAPVAQLGAGPNSGAVFIPEVSDEVLVAFENGDVDHPYVIGSLYNGVDMPSLGDGLFRNGKVTRRGFVSRKGHQQVFFDDDGKSGIALMTSDGNIKIALKESGQELHLQCQGSVLIESGGAMTFKSGSSMSIEAGTNLTLKGASGVKIESPAVVEVKGALVKLN